MALVAEVHEVAAMEIVIVRLTLETARATGVSAGRSTTLEDLEIYFLFYFSYNYSISEIMNLIFSLFW